MNDLGTVSFYGYGFASCQLCMLQICSHFFFIQKNHHLKVVISKFIMRRSLKGYCCCTYIKWWFVKKKLRLLLMSRACYEPSKALLVWKKFQETEKILGRVPKFLSTHPPPSDRFTGKNIKTTCTRTHTHMHSRTSAHTRENPGNDKTLGRMPNSSLHTR